MEGQTGALAMWLQILVPLVLLGAIAYGAYRWVNRNQPVTFAGSEPERRETTQEYRFDLEDVHSPDDHPPRV